MRLKKSIVVDESELDIFARFGVKEITVGSKSIKIKKTLVNMNEIIEVAEKLYYEANPNTKMDVPSFAYEQVELANKRRITAKSNLNLYDWCKLELSNSNK